MKSDPTARFCPGCGGVLNELMGRGPEGVDGGGQESTSDGQFQEGMSPNPPAGTESAAKGSISPHLVVISQDGSTGEMHWLRADSVDIGREATGIQLPADTYASPRHARILKRGDSFFVQDLDSTNGVYLRLRAPVSLQHGDLVLLGSEVLAYEDLGHADHGFGQALELGTEVYGSPICPRYGRLRQKTMEGVDRNVFYLSSDHVVIGRETGDIVFTADSFMSRKHAVLEREASSGTYALRDLGSSNGTYLGIRGEVQLREGDHLRVGQHLFRFGLEG